MEKTAVDEGPEARKSPQRGRQTPQRPNDAKAHSIARRGGADLTSQTRAKSARRPNGKAHVGTSWHPTWQGTNEAFGSLRGCPKAGGHTPPAGEGEARIVLCRVCRLSHKAA